MTILLIILGGVILASIRPVLEGCNEQYIDREHTQSINGIFILLVFLSHFSSYIDTSGELHRHYNMIQKSLGQMVVTTFLFYSGYGVAVSLAEKSGYTKNILKKRIPHVWLQFDIAVFLYALVRLGMGQTVTIKNLLLSLLAWNSLGNSNWYIFAIIFLYLFSYIAFTIYPPPDEEKNRYRGILLLSILCTLFCEVLRPFRPTYCYNTVFCYVLGALFALEKESIDSFLRPKYRYWIALAIVAIAFRIAHIFWYDSTVLYQFTACLFVLLIVLITMKVRIKSKLLCYCGKHLFSLYILQRIPMIVLQNAGLRDNLGLYAGISLTATFALSWCFDATSGIIERWRLKRG